MSTDTLLFFNGVNGASGGYLLPPMTPQAVSQLARGEPQDKQHIADLKLRYSQISQPHAGVMFGNDPTKLEESGWGIIFAANDANTAALKDALGELLSYRRTQAGPLYKELSGQDGYLPDEDKIGFLARHGAEVSGAVDPTKLPYYLLIVGDPEQIPYRFQYQLDVQYAVGRIYFDTLEAYAQYARSVVLSETGKVTLPRQATFFGVSNPDDHATNLSADQLVKPLSDDLARTRANWNVQTLLESQATKAQLGRLLGGAETPALLFTASHGMGFPSGDPRQFAQQGALLCQDWPGPLEWSKPIPQDFYFAGDDVSSDAKLLGLITFHFACYGAGTPRMDDFAYMSMRDAAPIAPHAFIGKLPQRLLGHPKGGALAVVGHVERAWGYSFMWGQASQQLNVFKSALKRMVAGQPLGCATEEFNNRYAELSSELTSELDYIKKGMTPDDGKVAGLWTANNDARAYVILGDPAVRLMVGDATTAQRPVLEPITLKNPVQATANAATLSASHERAEDEGEPDEHDGEQHEPKHQLDDGREPIYGLMDNASLKQAQVRLTQALQQFADKLSQTLNSVIDNATSLEVSTYVSDDLSGVTYDQSRFTGTAKLRVMTRINLDGDTLICVPATDGDLDERLWKIHLDMVARAQANRAEMIKAAVSAATGLLDALRAV